MPNWCENDLCVRGTKEELARFKEAVQGDDRRGCQKLICEDKIIPYPEHFRLLDLANPLLGGEKKALPEDVRQRLQAEGYDLSRDGYNQSGYEWCIENWGTKWGFCDVELVVESEGELQYTFNTAWSPPLPLIRKLGEMFPSLEFDLRYFEGGMQFNGMLRLVNGEVKDDCSGEYLGNRGG